MLVYLLLVGHRGAHSLPKPKAEDLAVAMGRRGDDDGDGLVDQTLVAWRMGMRAAGDFGRGGCTHYLDSAQIVASAPSHIHSIGATGPRFCAASWC